MPNIPFSDAIAARVGPEYGLGSDVARSLVREVLEIYIVEYVGSDTTKTQMDAKPTSKELEFMNS